MDHPTRREFLQTTAVTLDRRRQWHHRRRPRPRLESLGTSTPIAARSSTCTSLIGTPSFSRSSIRPNTPKMLVRSRSQSIVCYCQSHVGLFNYPTKVGKEHSAFQGRNMLGEMIEQCHRQEIAVQIYTSLIFDRWCADQHSDWRIRTPDGRPQGEGGRHGVLCVNSPYREYVRSFVREICQSFEFDGIRFDMTFWPSLCFCEYCKRAVRRRGGGRDPSDSRLAGFPLGRVSAGS